LEGAPPRHTLRAVLRALAVLALLYLFLTSIRLLSAGFKLLGTGFADELIRNTNNPLVGLFVGILVTSILQSSSVTTSMVVGFVAAGTLTVRGAIPIVMGANIGTTVTNTLVSFGCISRREEFRRALGGATVHDFFNVLMVVLLLPFELLTRAVFKVGYLEFAGTRLAELLGGSGAEGIEFHNPIKSAVQPLVELIKGLAERSFSPPTAATVVVITALVLLLGALFLIVQVLRATASGRLGVLFDRFIGSGGIVGILLGMVVTVAVQSSSVTLSLCVPMAAAGIVSLEQVFVVTLGANLGTTITALLASLTGNVAALAIALVHTLFNLTGILVFYPVKSMRKIPTGLARWYSGVASRSRWIAALYLVAMFFALPLLIILIGRLL
jgi:sodium-dependent phosphate cotransporter